MKETPILFSGPMVRAILENRKTQTRRVVKGLGDPKTFGANTHKICPYGTIRDRLWVRETWRPSDYGIIAHAESTQAITYAADGETLQRRYTDKPCGYAPNERNSFRPSIHMPRWASRITLEVTGVRVERVQDISEEDAECEGVEYNRGPMRYGITNARDAFRALWDSINSKRGYGWAVNPWVWVIEFKRVEDGK